MTDSNEAYGSEEKDKLIHCETAQVLVDETEECTQSHDAPVEKYLNSEKTLVSQTLNTFNEETVSDVLDKVTFEKEDNSSTLLKTLLTSTEIPKTSQEVVEKPNNEDCSLPVQQDSESETTDKVTLPQVISEGESDQKVECAVSSKSETMGIVPSCQEDKENTTPDNPHTYRIPENYTDSSHSSSSELPPVVPFEGSAQENIFNDERLNFENAVDSSEIWRKDDDSGNNDESGPMERVPAGQSQDQSGLDIPLIELDDTTQHSGSRTEVPAAHAEIAISMEAVFPISLPPCEENLRIKEPQTETKTEEQAPEQPVPAPPPAPRKRGRPRKQVLPNPSPLVESWGPNAQEFPSLEPQPKERKRPARPERRQTKRKKFDDETPRDVEEETPKRKSNPKPPVKKKKRRATYTPKKRGPQPKKKAPEVENIQNFEEETRMSASEGFPSKSGATGDESQGSSMAEGLSKTNVNKKGRMEVLTDGCKPVTVQQIVEYYWPPPSSLPHGEKPEGLMIQEQITEYLGVKSFKRKYPSIKRRPVDMEERNYLQENGFVSENMCDMGLTAVFSADILEIMYNDFPQKFEEYRKYTREKKAKEQRALREKQAAERADMDPKKEAVESAFTWNSEFNRTRRGKMDQSPKNTYNSKVLLGNWFEQNCRKEDKLALYLKKKERKQVLTIGVRRLFDNFLRNIPLSLPTKGLAYGGVIQLLAPDVVSGPPYDPDIGKGVVLSATIESVEIDQIQCIIEDLKIVGSPLKEPCARNTFIVESCEGKEDGQAVCYGDMFTLKSADNTDFPLYVELGVYGLGSRTGKCGSPNPSLKIYRSRDAREKRASCIDLQTFTVQFPSNRYKQISLGKPGHYPIALIPGQNTDYYKKYTSNELKYFPLNTVLYGPLRPNERHFPLPGGSDGSQSEIDDSSSSDESSSSSSEETQDTEGTSSTGEEEPVTTTAVEVKLERLPELEEKETPKASRTVAKTPKGRGRGKVVASADKPPEQKKRIGRPPKMKMKLASVKLKRLDGEELSELIKQEKLDPSTRVIIHTCKMCHEEESKNKNGDFERFIQCAQCKGKIHPSCIDLTQEMIPKISSYGWQCTDCKSCVECGQSSNEDKMIFCDQCDRGYHIFCVGLNEVPSGNYICGVCKPSPDNSKTEEESSKPAENGVEVMDIKEESEIKQEETEEENEGGGGGGREGEVEEEREAEVKEEGETVEENKEEVEEIKEKEEEEEEEEKEVVEDIRRESEEVAEEVEEEKPDEKSNS